MSLYTMAFIGTSPLGSILAGSVAHKIGAPHTLMLSGILCILAGVGLWRLLPAIRRMVHPVFVRKGIIPQVARGIGIASQLTMEPKE